ncbi:mitochondrial sodium/calcium exchanger protein isoform X2 [Drosophila teissieri]|uniref:mitochondrial sodium/calcium exchanger protein isoform X2 n=1 Tax=Drosophila teissieri TaxID=7243 RepID=UPI001CBA0FCA|nr:mitochondrial sodium/calcium exchanger protein isoform X2 [Drosophila teissieri]
MGARTKSANFNLTELDYEFQYFIKNMSCRAVMRLPYTYRCRMATQVSDCKRIINFFNYFRMMYCSIHIDDKTTEVLFMFLFAFICVAFLWLMSFNIGTYFSPVLKIISIKLHMNEYLAGVTFLAFGNCSPEIIANLMPVRADAPIFTIAVGNTLAIILLSGGTVCFLRPFRMNGHSTLRDLLFLLLGVEVLRYVMVKEGAVTLGEGIVLFSIYVVYVAINIADVALLRYYIKKLRRELDNLRSLTPPPIKEINAKLRKLTSWEEQDDIGIKDTTKYRRSRDTGNHFSNMTSSGYFVTPRPENRPEHIDYETNRKGLHNPENPRNLQLFTEFFQSLNPVDGEAWQLGGWSNRVYLIARCPLVFVLQLFIPVVDYEKVKHGWSKLLNCTQIVTNPFVVITLVHCSWGVQRLQNLVHNPRLQSLHVVAVPDSPTCHCDLLALSNGCAALLSPPVYYPHFFQFHGDPLDRRNRTGSALRDRGNRIQSLRELHVGHLRGCLECHSGHYSQLPAGLAGLRPDGLRRHNRRSSFCDFDQHELGLHVQSQSSRIGRRFVGVRRSGRQLLPFSGNNHCDHSVVERHLRFPRS